MIHAYFPIDIGEVLVHRSVSTSKYHGDLRTGFPLADPVCDLAFPQREGCGPARFLLICRSRRPDQHVVAFLVKGRRREVIQRR